MKRRSELYASATPSELSSSMGVGNSSGSCKSGAASAMPTYVGVWQPDSRGGPGYMLSSSWMPSTWIETTSVLFGASHVSHPFSPSGAQHSWADTYIVDH
eukprot:2355615-Rhodomonas_salina.1